METGEYGGWNLRAQSHFDQWLLKPPNHRCGPCDRAPVAIGDVEARLVIEPAPAAVVENKDDEGDPEKGDEEDPANDDDMDDDSITDDSSTSSSSDADSDVGVDHDPDDNADMLMVINKANDEHFDVGVEADLSTIRAQAASAFDTPQDMLELQWQQILPMTGTVADCVPNRKVIIAVHK